MPFDINNFKAYINQKNFAYSSHFEVFVTRPDGGNSGVERELAFRIEATDIPGRGVMTSDVVHYGLTYRMPYGSTILELPISVILSEGLDEKIYFESWVDKIVGNYRTGETSPNMFDIGYYNDFIGTMTIRRFNSIGELVYQAELREVYPLSVGSIPQSWGPDEILKLNVVLAYRYYVEIQ